MSNDVVIKVENLSKRYRLGLIGGKTLHEDVQRWWAKLRGKPDPFLKVDQLENFQTKGSHLHAPSASLSRDYIWALRNISFEVKQGEILGIIGKNGAGKSTLLKILTKITAPTHGVAKIKGRVGSLLEVGTGFHPELTGRENIFLNGAILGMTRVEIMRKFDEIVNFAEIEKFIDTPVKRYSSGMYVRLAFAVAAHLEPEILLVDEVLAVGDLAFQKKCLGKMSDVSKEGRTVLFVSHNMTAVKTLCDKTMLLEEGRVQLNDETSKVVKRYAHTANRSVLERKWDVRGDAPGNEEVRLIYAGISTDDIHDINYIDVTTPLNLEFHFINFKPKNILNLSLVLYNQENIFILNTGSNAAEFSEEIIKGVCHIPSNFLNSENYTVRLLIVKNTSTPLIDFYELLSFEVNDIERKGAWMGKWEGLVRPQFNWDVTSSKHISEI